MGELQGTGRECDLYLNLEDTKANVVTGSDITSVPNDPPQAHPWGWRWVQF